MQEQPLPVFRSVFGGETLAAHALAYYDCGPDAICHLWQRGISDSYRVQSAAGRWFLRVGTADGRSPAEVRAEVEILQHLTGAGIAVPVPVQRWDGARLTLLPAPEGARPAVLFAFIEGRMPDRLTPEQAQTFGRALARLHLAADEFVPVVNRPQHDRAYFIEEPLARLDAFPPFAPYESERRLIREAAETLWAAAADLPQAAPYFGLCHGDLMRGNGLWTEDGDLTILDFDYCGYGWRVYDLATFIWAEVYDGFTIDWSQGDVFRAFVAGYEAVRPLLVVEREALRIFAGLRQMFLFEAALKNAPAFGIGWMEGWLERSIAFIEACLADDWLARVGLDR